MRNPGFYVFLTIAFFGTFGWFGLFALVSPSLASAAVTDERSQVEKARAHFEHGERLYKVSRYREALEEFKEGFVAKADPVFLFNIAQCHRLLGDRDDALTFYRRYLQADPRSFRRAEVERRINDLEAQQAADPTPRTAPPPVVAATPVAPPPPSGPALGSLAAANPTAQTAAPPILSAHADEPAPSARPLYKRWWLWTGIGVVAAAVTTTLILSGSDDGPCGAVQVVRCEKL